MIKLDEQTREQYQQAIITSLDEDEINQFRETFLKLHPSDQLDIFITLSKEQRNQVYTYISPKEMAEIFDGLGFHKQRKFLQELNVQYAIDMFNRMFTDDLVSFLNKSNEKDAASIINQLHKEKAEKVRFLLAYESETAGAIMTHELVSINKTNTVSEVLDLLRDIAPNAEIVYYLYVVDQNNELVGVVSLRDIIVAAPDTIIANIMNKHPVFVPDDLDQEDVGKLIQKYDFLAVPVVSQEHHLLGIITVDDIMDILEAETTEDFGEFSTAKEATDIHLSVFTAAKKRSPWIITLMFFGLITGGVIDRFEDTLESVVLLAVFIPMIMDSGGNVGTQSLAISVRGIALGTIEKNSVFKMIRREFSTGLLIGAICMIVIALLVIIFYGNPALALIVGTSILATLSISAVIGAVVPLIINKLNFDPAIASGPFITTLNDVIGLLIYFSIATSLIELL